MQTKVIVVGVDGSDGSRRALRWALEQAERTGDVVHAVTAWNWESADVIGPATTGLLEESLRAEQIAAEEVANAIDERGTHQPVHIKVVQGRPGRVLAEAAASARLLVLGSHGHSRLYHAVLGSVTEECVRAATCPVVVLPIAHPQHQAPSPTPAGTFASAEAVPAALPEPVAGGKA